MGVPRDWGSGGHGRVAGGFNFGLEELSEAEAEFAVEDRLISADELRKFEGEVASRRV
jgi:hypothetical protein